MRRNTMFFIIIILLVISIIINVSEVKVTKYVKEECMPCESLPGWKTINLKEDPTYPINYSNCNYNGFYTFCEKEQKDE